VEARDAIIKLIRLGWGKNNPAFRQIFTTRFLPDGTPEEADWFDDLQRITAPPENAARFMEEFSRIDVRAILGDIKVPTIVFHSQDDRAVAFDEGRLLAAAIRGATFVPLPGPNHLLLEHEPAWQIMRRELSQFLGWKS
jgi:pimeloyl-ACP methyl ester carboxylesterase